MTICNALAFDWSAAGSLLSGVGTVAIAWFAYVGLSAWKTQFKGTRQLELAQELLEVAYEAEEVMRYVTAPFMPAAELERIERKPGESDDDYRIRQNYEAVHARYMEHVEVFTRLRALCFGAKARLGNDVHQAAKRVVSLPDRVFLLCDRLAHADAQVRRLERQSSSGIPPDPDAWNSAVHALNTARNELYGLDQEGRLAAGRAEAVKDLEDAIRERLGRVDN